MPSLDRETPNVKKEEVDETKLSLILPLLSVFQDGKPMPPSGFASAVASFRAILDNPATRHVCFLTGAGVSAESGIPTFRGEGGLWRTYAAQDLATPQAFRQDPSLVWEFYHYRREVVSKCKPNDGHFAIAALQRKFSEQGKKVTILTQNIDRLHQAAGAKDVIELHGSLWLLKKESEPGFIEDGVKVWEDCRVPLAPCFEGKCQPDPKATSTINVSELPHKEGELLRPAVVWFNEGLDPRTMDLAYGILDDCDMFVVAGTSAVVYPAAGFAPYVSVRGKPVVEVNLDQSGNSEVCQFSFQGKSGELLPEILGLKEQVQALKKERSGGH